MPDQNPHLFDSRLTALETRVDAIGSTLNSVAEAVTGLADKIDKSNTPNWGWYFSGLGVLIAILGALGLSWKAPLDTALNALSADVRLLQGGIVTRETHSQIWKQQEREADDIKRRIERLESRATPTHP